MLKNLNKLHITIILVIIVSTLIILFEILDLYSDRSMTVKVMSFNILNSEKDVGGVKDWSDRSLFVANIIRNHSDIAGLQEVLRDQKNSIEFLLDPMWGHIGTGRDGGDDGEYCSIFYSKERFEADEYGTFWFSNRPDVPDTKPGKKWGSPDQKRICTWARFIEKSSGRGFYFYNLHLSHNGGATNPQLNRRKSVMLLQERIQNRRHGDDPFIITGDFNAKPTEESSIGLMLGRTYISEIYLPDIDPRLPEETITFTTEPLITCKDTWITAYPERPFEKTSHGGDGGEGRGRRIDYIFVQEDVGVIGANILRFAEGGYYPSDHYPITAHVSIQFLN